MYCKNCGSAINDGDAFCPNCGTPVANDTTPGNQQEASPQGTYDPNQQGSYTSNQPNTYASGQQDAYQASGQQNTGDGGSFSYAPVATPGSGSYNGNASYQNDAYQNTYNNNGYRQYPTPRSIALCIVLSLITCGIYGIYWLIVMVNDLNTVTNRTDNTSGGMVFLLSLITCNIYMWYWAYKAGQQIDDYNLSVGRPTGSRAILYLILCLVGLDIVTYALIQSEINTIIEQG